MVICVTNTKVFKIKCKTPQKNSRDEIIRMQSAVVNISNITTHVEWIKTTRLYIVEIKQ